MFYTIIGTQWGDEGKGKIVDWLASKADVVVRFQGGNNAGHTIQIEDKIFKLNLLKVFFHQFFFHILLSEDCEI